MATYDLLVRGGLVFDGTGAPGRTVDIGVRGGKVVAMAPGLSSADAGDVIDADGKWVIPGMVDVHTHYDAEVLVSPGLGESVRHGVTSVIYGNCSMSAVYADPEDVADLFARVEALPWDAVHSALKEHKDWDDKRKEIFVIVVFVVVALTISNE